MEESHIDEKLYDELPPNNNPYIVVGYVDKNTGEILSGVTYDGSSGHANLRSHYTISVWFRYRSYNKNLYYFIYTKELPPNVIENIKNHLKQKYGITDIRRVTGDDDEYSNFGHKIDEVGMKENTSNKTEHFHIEFGHSDISNGAGKIFLNNDIWFANVVQITSDWDPKHAGLWYINRHKGAFDLKFPSLNKYYSTFEELLNNLEDWYSKNIKESTEPSIGGSYSDQQNSNLGNYDVTQLERDPLTDPELTGKNLQESYKFHDFKWLANMAGFGMPTDVYYGVILLGVIESEEDGYVIQRVVGPLKTIAVKKSDNNKFKTKIDAAKSLHQLWKNLRNNKI